MAAQGGGPGVRAPEQAAEVGPLAFFSPEHRADPYPSYAALRAAGPVPLPGVGLAVGDHATCSALLRDGRLSVERRRSRVFAAAVRAGLVPDPEARLEAAPFLFRDPPDHTRLRGLVARAFTRRVVANLEPQVESITGQLLDAARDRGGDLELVADLAYPLPVRVICALLGVPESDHATFAGWSTALAGALDPSVGTPNPGRFAAEQAAYDEFGAYFTELFDLRRKDPRDDLLTGLVHAEADGQRLTAAELVSTCVLLLVAGHETTVSLIANGGLALLRHPDQWDRLVADPQLAGGCAEEALRYDPPVQLTGRIAREPVEVGGLPAEAGDVVMLVLAAAGRDPQAFRDPDTFDITRSPDDGALKHLAFSAGIHFCLGAPLARLEAEAAFRALATRLREPALTEAPAYKDNLVLRGLSTLRVGYADLL